MGAKRVINGRFLKGLPAHRGGGRGRGGRGRRGGGGVVRDVGIGGRDAGQDPETKNIESVKPNHELITRIDESSERVHTTDLKDKDRRYSEKSLQLRGIIRIEKG